MLPEISALAAVIPPAVDRICRQLAERGYKSWVVGGAVRDVLLAIRRGQDVGEAARRCDWDLATDALPEQMLRLFRRVVPTGIEHGTVSVVVDKVAYEVTTLRGESGYSDGRHPDAVVYIGDIEGDLARRDFTINAMAYDVAHRHLIDPFGGVADLEAGRLRAVGDPRERFTEDGLRVLRAARFAATLGFDLDAETARGILPSLDSYRRVSAERVRDEWKKALRAPRPSVAFRLIEEHGLLEITASELQATVGCTQNRYHAFDVWEHTLRCLDACPDRPSLRLAALLHDIGKPVVRAYNPEKGDVTFYEHEVRGAELARGLLERLRFSNEERDRTEALVRHHIVQYDESWTDAAVRRWMRRVTPELVDDVLALNRADVQAKGTDASDDLARLDLLERRVLEVTAEGSALSVRDLAVNGRDLMSELGLAQGPEIGRVLAELLEKVTDDPGLNERQHLLDLARQLLGR